MRIRIKRDSNLRPKEKGGGERKEKRRKGKGRKGGRIELSITVCFDSELPIFGDSIMFYVKVAPK